MLETKSNERCYPVRRFIAEINKQFREESQLLVVFPPWIITLKDQDQKMN
jgi:hypothetical protein